MPDQPPFLRLDAVSKTYGGVHALEEVSLEIQSGEVHALCGENGAGKSTLIKILTGVVRPDSGTIWWDGRQLATGNVHAAEHAGIAVIHQESTAFPDLNAVDNIFVGREILRGWQLDRVAMRQQAATLLDNLGESIDLNRPVRELSLAQRQMVSVARALVGNCRLLIMDEPTASLSHRETETLFQLIRRLQGQGISVLYVSHRLEEIFLLADRITVLRDGRWVATRTIREMNRDSLIELMVGRPLTATSRRTTSSIQNEQAPPLLDVRDLTRTGTFQNITLQVCAGEIVGLGGLVGAGRSEVALAIFGIEDYDSGTILVNGHSLRKHRIQSSLDAGLALVPEDRQHEGLILPLSIGTNVSLAMLSRLCRLGCIRFRPERELIEEQLANLRVKSDGMHPPAATLSGGNQQKLVLGKWLAVRPKILILDEPTRGIDVGAKEQFHSLIRQLAGQGVGILLISSELPELLSLSDRILVMRQGRIVGELSQSAATPEAVLNLALPDGEPLLSGASHA